MPHTNGSGAKSRLPYRRTKLAVPVKNTRREATLFVDSIFRLIRSGLVQAVCTCVTCAISTS